MKLRTEAEIDADLVRDHTGEILGARRFCAVLWGFVLAFAIAAQLLGDARGMLLTFAAAVVMSFITLGLGKLTRDERLVRPLAYRVVTAVMLAGTLFGVVLAFVPHASEASQLCGAYFGLVAILSYRGLVNRGPRAAVWTVVIAMWTWIPIAFVSLLGCSCGRFRRVPHWTELASFGSLRVILFLLPVLAITALLAFSPRRDFVPDARVIKAAGR